MEDSRICEPANRNLIVVRAATAEDAESIVNIHFRAVHETARTSYSEHVLQSWSPTPGGARTEKVRQNMGKGELFLLAEFDGVPCGFGSIFPANQQLCAVFVDPVFGRRGVGSAILLRLEALAIQLGVLRLSMDASINAEAFYRKQGFAVVNRGIHRLSSGLEMACVKMSKVLA